MVSVLFWVSQRGGGLFNKKQTKKTNPARSYDGRGTGLHAGRGRVSPPSLFGGGGGGGGGGCCF
eukprot:COSAG06_NODE_62117_length_266_cov_0.508982_1_plen_63_part_01